MLDGYRLVSNTEHAHLEFNPYPVNPLEQTEIKIIRITTRRALSIKRLITPDRHLRGTTAYEYVLTPKGRELIEESSHAR